MATRQREIDTSTLGPIRITYPPRSIEVTARELFARSVEAKGPAWRNSANSIRSGFSNCWIEAGVHALIRALRSIPEEDHGRLLG